MGARAIVLAALATSIGTATDSVDATNPTASTAQPARGSAGFICLWAIYATMAEVGKKCPGAGNAAVDAELERSVSRLEDYAHRHSPAGAAFMARYRASQIEGHAGVCGAEALQMYEHFARNRPEELRHETDRLLASSPPVEWGDCL